ncbi:MAG: prepilin-type N-terminal cleavage/methylation domain-containing protein [Caldimonas sp.]
MKRGVDRREPIPHPAKELAARTSCRNRQRSLGFTLIELMIVLVLIAVASSVASLALRDPAATTLEREGARLAALLESARAEARASGLIAYWEPRTPAQETPGFRFVGLPPSEQLPTSWLESGVTAEVVGARAVLLGPEPLIGAQRIVLRLREQRLTLVTDGLGPFTVADESETVAR